MALRRATEYSVSGGSRDPTRRAVPGWAGSRVEVAVYGIEAHRGDAREGVEAGVVGLHDHAMAEGGERVADRRIDARVDVGLLALAGDARCRDGGGAPQLGNAPVDERVEHAGGDAVAAGASRREDGSAVLERQQHR